MLKKPAISRGTVIGVSFIIATMAALYFVPSLTRQTRYSLNLGSAGKSADSSFPVDRELILLEVGSDRVVRAKGKKSVADYLKESPGGVLVNFWATWCPPCIEEFPSLEYLNRQLAQNKGGSTPMIVAISVDDGIDEISTLFKSLEFAPSMHILHDPAGDFSTSVGTTKFPETYLVDTKGKIAQKWLGPQNWLSTEVLGVLNTASR